MIGFLELRPNILMTAGALAVDLDGLSHDKTIGAIGVNLVTRHAGDRIVAMAALQAPDVSGLIQVGR